MTERVAQVVVPRPLPALSYLVPAELEDRVKTGTPVEVPFRSGSIVGFIVGFTTTDDPALKDFKLKPIRSVPFSLDAFDEIDAAFFNWISDYYQLPLGDVFHSAFPKSVFAIPKRKRAEKEAGPEPKLPAFTPPKPTADQTTALTSISKALDAASYASFLLFGVTGSGKTEVYLQAARQTLEAGHTALILVPEIALTPQLRSRFEERFGNEVAVLHSGMGDKTRREQWWAIRRGEKRVVVGARSAIFAPLSKLGLVVVDEEHEPSYKQEDRLRYNARDLALVRARQHGAVAILGSATPSIETFQSALSGKHTLLELKNRPAQRPLPEVTVVDLKMEREEAGNEHHDLHGGFGGVLFSRKFIEGLEQATASGEQSMIFVNRKGYSSFLMCSDCGEVPRCLNCDVSLTYYKSSSKLRCHYCAYEIKAPNACPECASNELKFMGLGTELIEKELARLQPKARIVRLDAETADTSKKIEAILTDFREGKIDILVGTQMLAKGHDFPNVTFIGVVLADMSLHLPDFRAGERTFQLLSQVAGRAGRGDKPGRVVLQTFMPEHYVIETATRQDYRAFFEQEVSFRKEFGYPPFSKIAQLEFRHLKENESRKQAERASKLLAHILKPGSTEVHYLGPSPASIYRIANQYRWQILLKSEKSSSLNAVIKTLRKDGVRFIDVDPVTTL